MRLRIVSTGWTLLIACVAYFALMFFGHLADHLILFPTTAPIDAGGAVRKTIPFENGELEIWTAQSKRAQQQGRADLFILRFYGNADRADRWPALEAGIWKDRAVEIWGMNYPGFGGSTGGFSGQRDVDAFAANVSRVQNIERAFARLRTSAQFTFRDPGIRRYAYRP